MKRIFELLFVGLFLLVACRQVTSTPVIIKESQTPTVTPSRTLQPSQTSEPTRTRPAPTSNITSTPSITPTGTLSEWTETYPTKQALVIYGAAARTQYSAQLIERGYFEFNPFLTLYADGQLIFGSGRSEKYLSQQDTNTVLAYLENMGFFQIQDTGAIDEQNPIYTFPDGIAPFPGADPDLISITVNGKESKTIRYMTKWEQYLNQPMKDIVLYLKSFSSDNAKPYQPDRLLVGIIVIDETFIPEDAIVIPWPNDITPPSESSRYDTVLYLEGVEALKLYKTVIENPDAYFIYDGIKFIVNLRPILPNECHIYHYHFNADYPNSQPFFSCDDW